MSHSPEEPRQDALEELWVAGQGLPVGRLTLGGFLSWLESRWVRAEPEPINSIDDRGTLPKDDPSGRAKSFLEVLGLLDNMIAGRVSPDDQRLLREAREYWEEIREKSENN